MRMKTERREKTIKVFFELLRAGLWEQAVRLSDYDPIDFDAIYELADEQAVIGQVAAGLEHVVDRKVVKQEALPFLKKVFGLEGKNASMNQFIASLFDRMQGAGIYAVLIKGQGVGQCYERPQWRSLGDVDLFLDHNNYKKAKPFLTSIAECVEEEDSPRLHLALTIDSWVVELHGTMRTRISSRVNRVIDAVQRDIFQNGSVRAWRDGDVDVFLPGPNEDVLIVFTHFLEHFYVGGIGLRQICDWCRLLWTYRDRIDCVYLEKRLKEMGLMREWKAFASLAVEWLGMPKEAIPFHSEDIRFKRKASRICPLILETGNFGHNKDESYRVRYSKLVGYFITFWRRLKEFLILSTIFPMNAPKFFVSYVLGRTKAAF